MKTGLNGNVCRPICSSRLPMWVRYWPRTHVNSISSLSKYPRLVHCRVNVRPGTYCGSVLHLISYIWTLSKYIETLGRYESSDPLLYEALQWLLSSFEIRICRCWTYQCDRGQLIHHTNRWSSSNMTPSFRRHIWTRCSRWTISRPVETRWILGSQVLGHMLR